MEQMLCEPVELMDIDLDTVAGGLSFNLNGGFNGNGNGNANTAGLLGINGNLNGDFNGNILTIEVPVSIVL
jgi:hypothetical protein